ncbi:HAD-IA family hydrolase [Sphingomonas sp. AR_OL41]|uniref:HAD family hydrolase n=1 Tax=Sphingomonas sp. AR_OL41 TaxID=3042729 RepID=UPI002480E3B4|nr:HAD-IA family hydrolase [Sphingomonas sp. AR_OL41]MDH7972808.1 HAD-IA family hydrolase [Sphingomonas sp. AR_OL41]
MPTRFPSPYDAIFFDFDGVIADSVDAKIMAFGELYRDFGPEVRSAVMAYQRAVPGETRFDKIPKFHRELLGIELTQAEIISWCDRLSDIVLDAVVASPLLPDVPEVLALLQAQGVPAHIVSGTPHDELQIIVERKGLRRFFASARGAPQKKHVIVEEILAAQSLVRERCLFVGDAMTDHDCARVCAMDFLGRAPAGQSPFPPGTRVVERLGEAFLTTTGLRRAA